MAQVTPINPAATAETAQQSTQPRRPKFRKKKSKATSTAATQRPERSLPTERITFKRQLDLLRAFAAASGPTGKSVTNREVAPFVKMTENTTLMANGFFLQTGLLVRSPGGLIPAPEVVSFHRAHDWNPETASHKLGPLIGRTWFAEALTPRLSLNAMEEDQAIAILAEAAGADPKYKANLRLLIDYLEAAGLIQREGSQVRLVRATQTGNAGVQSSDEPSSSGEERKELSASAASLATAFLAPVEGTVQFHVSVKVNMAEFKGWPPETVAAFFGGIAQVLNAKAALEKRASNDE
jgi:hypothetical protein